VADCEASGEEVRLSSISRRRKSLNQSVHFLTATSHLIAFEK